MKWKEWLLLLIVALCMTGCADKKIEVSSGTYTLQDSEEILKPRVTLNEDETFEFTYSALSSYLAYGTYEIKKDTLLLKTDDKKYEYAFQIKKDVLIFDAEQSSEFPDYADVPDGAVFNQ